jgi:tricorn protease interacting factor F2/3
VLEYDIALDIDTAENSFRGSVQISGITAAGPVELDSVDLEIESVQVEETPIKFAVDEKRHKLAFSRPSAGSERIRITYSGKAGRDVQTGLFVARIGSAPALSTQMEPESCRRLLPCFDQPDRKAVFRLEVTIPRDLVAISNMPSETHTTPDHRARWVFAATPEMSSYLLYLGVGPFEETIDDDGPTLIVVAGRPGLGAGARRTARIARDTLRAFGDYFEIPYPLPKLHFVALSDFWAGMENWGAISGAEDQYLLDEDATPRSLGYADQTIVHEIAHQWFGNLVTLRTWDDLWLNESFATFATPVASERAKLHTDAWSEFTLRGQPAFRFDSLNASHPVKPESLDAAEILANADEITYLKGSRLIRMIEAFVGADQFRDGITEYLNDHRYGNAESDDLWVALEEESQRPVTRVMRAWVERAGHPCVTIRQVGPDVEFSQRRFFLVPNGASDKPWPIPLTLGEGTRRDTVVFDQERWRLPDRDAAKLTIDPGRTGFFRVLWATELRGRRIASLLEMAPEDRAGFCQDAEGFLLSGDYSLDEYAEMLRVVGGAKDRLTVEGVARSLDILEPILSGVPRFHDAARGFCAAQWERLGERSVPGEPEGTDTAREWVYWVRARLDSQYSATLSSRFDSIDAEPPFLRQAIANAFARHGGAGSAERIMSWVTGPDSVKANVAAFAVAGTTDPSAILAAIDSNPSAVPLANLGAYLLPSLASNPVARDPLWKWLTVNFHELERRSVGTTMLSLGCSRVLPRVGLGRADAVRAYFEQESFPEARPGIRSGLELLGAYDRLRQRASGTAA